MAEIRKFKPGAGSDIAQALAKAMGEGVRPATPGAPPRKKPAAPKPASPTSATATSAVFWDPFLKTAPRPPQKKADQADDADKPTEADEA